MGLIGYYTPTTTKNTVTETTSDPTSETPIQPPRRKGKLSLCEFACILDGTYFAAGLSAFIQQVFMESLPQARLVFGVGQSPVTKQTSTQFSGHL